MPSKDRPFDLFIELAIQDELEREILFHLLAGAAADDIIEAILQGKEVARYAERRV